MSDGTLCKKGAMSLSRSSNCTQLVECKCYRYPGVPGAAVVIWHTPPSPASNSPMRTMLHRAEALIQHQTNYMGLFVTL
jgi:hypothetical protein